MDVLGMKMDKVHIGLAVGNIVFAILSVVFIILFATKHDSSSAFLLSSQMPSNISFDQFGNELKSKLEQKYVVGTLAASALGPLGNFVFSLRGVQDLNDLQTLIASDPILAASQITDGRNAIDVCNYGRQPAPPPATTTSPKPGSADPQTTVTVPVTGIHEPTNEPPTTVITAPPNSLAPTHPPPATNTLQPSSAAPPTNKLPTTVATRAPPNTRAPTPAENGKYCEGLMKRDIVLVIDTAAPISPDDKKTALANLQNTLSARIPFESGARVAIVNLQNGQAIGDFAADASSFDNNWEQLLHNSFNTTVGSIDVFLAYRTIATLLKQSNPVEAILLTDHFALTEPENDVRLKGVFVSAVLPTKLHLPIVDKLTTVSKSYANWTDMAAQDPFATLFCQYNDGTVMLNNARIESDAEEECDPDSPKCQKLDIIIVFDTSQSVVEPFVEQYVQFSIDFIKQYTLTGAPNGDNTRTGVIQFNETANTILNLADNSLDTFITAVNGVHYTGGTTNITEAMKRGRDMFNEASSTRGKAMVILSDGQPYPSDIDTWPEMESMASELRKMNVSIFFVGDENGYDAETGKNLSRITGNPNWIFNNVADASVLPQDLLQEYPCICPQIICELAYYAVELSEITTEQNQIQSLQFILQVAQNVYNQKNSTQFQLMVYNENQTLLLNDADYSFDTFKSIVTRLIQDNEYRHTFSSGHTRLDEAINFLAGDMAKQQKLNELFQSSVLFAGQANAGALDPLGNETAVRQNLMQAAENIKSFSLLVYALDDSRNNTEDGEDLWNLVVNKTRTIYISSDNLERDLEATDYYQQLQAIKCELDLATCTLNFIDLGVAFDLTGPMTDNVTDYVKTMLGQFDTNFTAHISMYGYGGGKQPRILASLSIHEDMNDAFSNLTRWQLGLPFNTTKGDEMKLFGADDYINITPNDIDGLFGLIHSQFGCGSYSDDADRIPVPNVIFFISDNFESYSNVWDKFAAQKASGWECDDCPGTPSYLFLSSNTDAAPLSLGTTYNINDPEAFDLTSSQKAVNNFNFVINGICNMPMKDCCTYRVPNTCQRTKEFWQSSKVTEEDIHCLNIPSHSMVSC